jgi:glycosyltransferase involved in cell wall biosynthesis
VSVERGPRDEPARATIVITTHNRRDELRNAIASALRQSAPLDVLVVDDGSTDGTPEMVRAEFPTVRLHRDDQRRGYIVQRNRGAALARTNVIVSIDDDAVLVSRRTVEQTLAEFDHPRVGAVAIPFVDVKFGPTVYQRAPDDGEAVHVVSEYIGTAHALRRDLFLATGGYYEPYNLFTEERDYGLRMLADGYVVRLGRADPLHHLASPQRSWRGGYYYRARNALAFAWRNVPIPMLPAHWAATHWNVISSGVRRGHPFWTLHGVLAGYWISMARVRRTPVSRAVYTLSRRLVRSGSLPLSEIESSLPPLKTLPTTG